MKKNQKGFTFVELILYIAIVAVFMIALINFTWDIIYARVKSSVHQEVNQNIRLASSRMVYEIRNASAINSVGASTISLSMDDSSRDPTVFDIDTGRLRIGYGNFGSCSVSSPCALTSNKVEVTALEFTDLSGGNSENIHFSITIESNGESAALQRTQTYKTSAEVRSN